MALDDNSSPLGDLSKIGSSGSAYSSSAFPGYVSAADNHNMGNSGDSWFDPTTWGDGVTKAGKFTAVSVLSGAASVYDSAVTVTNWFGADVKLRDNQEWITSLDQDLGQYYGENRQAADLAGFVATSLIPGMGGVKILNAGQSAIKGAVASGKIGANMSRATGILAPNVQNYVSLAKAEIRASQTTFTVLNGNALKALGSGVHQNVLEGLAFETFVQATMFKSPILDEQDGMDIVKNIAMGGAVGGVIGGAFEAAKTISGLKKYAKLSDQGMKEFNARELVQPGTRPSDRIILGAENREITGIPGVSASIVGNEAANAVDAANAAVAVAKKSTQIDNEARIAMHEMNSEAPTELINAIADTQKGMSLQTGIANFHNALEITSPGNITRLEIAAIKEGRQGEIASRWIALGGENAGQTSYEMPAILGLSDRVKVLKGGSVADAVGQAVKDFKFKADKIWNPLPDTQLKNAWKEAEARHIWANTVDSKLLKTGMDIHENDLPLLERMFKDSRTDFRMQSRGGKEWEFTTPSDLKDYIIGRKKYIADEMMTRRISNLDAATNSIETSMAAIAKVTNVDVKFLEMTRDAVNPNKGLFAWQEQTAAAHNDLINAGIKNVNDVATPVYLKPQTAKINYQVGSDIDANGNVLDAMVHIRTQQKLANETATRIFTKQAGGDIAGRTGDIKLDQLLRSNSQGAAPGMTSFASGGYGSFEAEMQHLGGVSKDLQLKFRTSVDNQLQGALYNVEVHPESAIEVSTINQLLSKTSEDYVFDVANVLGMGPNVLIPNKVAKAAAKRAAGEEIAEDAAEIVLQKDAPQYIEFKNHQAAELFRTHTDMTSANTMDRAERYAALGKLDNRDAAVVRPMVPNARDFPYIAMVSDPRVSGAGHQTMLFANSEKELAALVSKTNREFPEFRVQLKSDTADWHRAQQSYDYALGLNENYVDSSLKREGIYSNFYTQTDPKKIVNEFLQYHYRAGDLASADLMRLRHGAAFDWLENQAVNHSALETSKFGGGIKTTDGIAQNEKNPYISYIKVGLNLPSIPTSNPWWSLNKFIDEQGSKLVGRVRQTFDSAKSPAELKEVNDLLQTYGSQTSINSGAEMALVNHTAPRAEISKFVRAANGIMSRFTLGLDPLNALNNAIGANVLRMTELNQITKGLSSSNSDIVGELAQLMKIGIPGVEGELITSPTKLVAKAIQRFWNPESRAVLLAQSKEQGFIRSRLEQFASMSDDLTLHGTESVGELGDRVKSAFGKAKELAGRGLDLGEKYTGNNLAEEFNRFISADVMRQITDVAEKHGILTPTESLTYINNFVNRVEGNTIATQRPGLFQGPIGQAIGLFQSYQFNMLQNMFRYVAEGSSKDLGMLMGLQGTFYGLQGTPGFKFLNDHVVGTLSGNQQHRDIYDATRGIAGKTGGDWLLYGAASNIMQTNIYSRGDINPRSITIVPTNIADVPFVGGMSKVFGTLFETAQKIGQGGNVWETIRQGIEHNGISRPLAGMAQVARGITGPEVFSTSGKGTLLGSNDLMSLASLSRVAGGRPLDEAIQNDTMFSINSYEAVDRNKKNLLAETVRTTQLPGQEASENQITQFAAAYAAQGGKQAGFAKYMMEQYVKSNKTQAEIMSEKLNNPLSYKIQALMGGSSN